MSVTGPATGKAWIKIAMRASPHAIKRMLERPPTNEEIAAVLAILQAAYLNRSATTEVERAYNEGWFA
jgi:hypothetical protein